jgi:hypothetical protein
MEAPASSSINRTIFFAFICNQWNFVLFQAGTDYQLIFYLKNYLLSWVIDQIVCNCIEIQMSLVAQTLKHLLLWYTLEHLVRGGFIKELLVIIMFILIAPQCRLKLNVSKYSLILLFFQTTFSKIERIIYKVEKIEWNRVFGFTFFVFSCVITMLWFANSLISYFG